MYNTKSTFYQSKIREAGGNLKSLYKITDTLLGRTKKTLLPDFPDNVLVKNLLPTFP